MPILLWCRCQLFQITRVLLFSTVPWPCFRDVFTITEGWASTGKEFPAFNLIPVLFVTLNKPTHTRENTRPTRAVFRLPNIDKMCWKNLQLRCFRDLIKLYCAPILIDKIWAVDWFLNVTEKNSLPVYIALRCPWICNLEIKKYKKTKGNSPK